MGSTPEWQAGPHHEHIPWIPPWGMVRLQLSWGDCGSPVLVLPGAVPVPVVLWEKREQTASFNAPAKARALPALPDSQGHQPASLAPSHKTLGNGLMSPDRKCEPKLAQCDEHLGSAACPGISVSPHHHGSG